MRTVHDRVLQEFRRRLLDIYGDRLVRTVLFGSQARGDASSGSDVDVLVVLRGPVRPGEEIERTGPATSALSLEYDIVLSCTFTSEESFSSVRTPLLVNVRQEGVTF